MDTPRDLERKALSHAYQMAGENFLAVKVLSKVFVKIESEADRVRHNDAIDELNILTEPDSTGFLKQVADTVIQTANKLRKDEK